MKSSQNLLATLLHLSPQETAGDVEQMFFAEDTYECKS